MTGTEVYIAWIVIGLVVAALHFYGDALARFLWSVIKALILAAYFGLGAVSLLYIVQQDAATIVLIFGLCLVGVAFRRPRHGT